MPRAIILAGPNGAGKTTFAREFLPNEGEIAQFVNVDLIAAGLSPFAPHTAEIAAGRAMMQRLEDLLDQGTEFALETTLSGKWLEKHIYQWQDRGYTVELYYLRLDNEDLAVERVRQRVREGGHRVQEDVIRRRFHRSLALLESKYKAIVDLWMVYDNSGTTPTLLSDGEKIHRAAE